MLNRLSREPHNALFKCFASEQAERDASFATLEEMGAKQWSPEMGEILTGLQAVLQKAEGGKMNNIVISPELVKQLGKEMEETVLANLTTEKRLAGLEPETVLSQYAPEQRLAGLEPEVVLSHYAPEQRLEGLNVEQRLDGLDLEVIQSYLNQHRQPPEPTKPRKKSAAHRKPRRQSSEKTRKE